MGSSPFSWPARELLFGRVVLIYQMPKIGSQAIELTLQQRSFPYPVRRFHYLSAAMTKTVRKGVSSRKPDPAWKRDARQQLNSIREITRLIRLRKWLLIAGFKIPKLEVITGVRELIGLVLSSIFENYLYFAPSIEAMTVERCREALLHPKTFRNLRNWFDLELKRFIGIDVFKTAFACEQGYAIYENRLARLLVYRFEVLPRLPPILQNFLGCPIPELARTNIGAAKAYAAQYGFVREHLRLPAEFVTELYSDKMMRNFYSDEERRKLFAQWADNPKVASGSR